MEHDCIDGAEKQLLRLANETVSNEKLCEKLKRENAKLDSDIKTLEEELKELKSKNEDLVSQERELEKKTSSARDAHKMYGHIAPGDITHQDVILSFDNFFKTTLRNLPRQLSAQSKEKYEVWHMTSDIVETSFEHCKDAIIKKINDKIADLFRAFHIFVNELCKEEIEQKHQGDNDESKEQNKMNMSKIKKNLRSTCALLSIDDDDADTYIDLIVAIVTQIDPKDYTTFIKDGKKSDDQP
ncbi:PREDICTED: cTAGE family member 5-like isoform X2 [Amphimedon queenslandica]|uniref:Uncharacterized protein n=1 Tax=Amphimedon queenslandica TaxID=400682 RepID=A0AAN0J1Z0_AMPQE|nr:PREDICTED: cTAGE family member 5-like isoform X2 [Amphimedon queenslandica]|eukprot:XP_019850741.1 PREDICTED: cTAGE family member 5-like isoform X2 [Amphimedon queenslandica]